MYSRDGGAKKQIEKTAETYPLMALGFPVTASFCHALYSTTPSASLSGFPVAGSVRHSLCRPDRSWLGSCFTSYSESAIA